MAQVKEMKTAISNVLIGLWNEMGMGLPRNHEVITNFIFDDISKIPNPTEWHSGDIAMAFQHWIEVQSMSVPQGQCTHCPY